MVAVVSIDMFPDAAVEYIVRMHESDRGYNDWMEHAIAAHSHKAHDDFYDMIGEDLYSTHSTYYPNCDDALEFYIEEGERDFGPQAWTMTPYGAMWRVKGYDSAIASFAETNPDWLLFFGPDSAEEVGQDLHRKPGNIVYVESVVVTDGTEPTGANPIMAAQWQSGTGVGTQSEGGQMQSWDDVWLPG